MDTGLMEEKMRAYGPHRRSRGGYDRGYDYDETPYGRYGTPLPGNHGYPSARWGWGPIGWTGWGPGLSPWPYGAAPADEPGRTPRRRPEESPTYGRGGDRMVQRWGQRYGYDVEYTIRPHNRFNR
jgi:hypothetical protein